MKEAIRSVAKRILRPPLRMAGQSVKSVMLSLHLLRSRFNSSDISIFHGFLPPPYGGGNQFLLALRGEMEKLGVRTEVNTISPTTRACLYNSFNFDFDRLRKFARPGCRMIHRVDGPTGVYRGRDDGTDYRIWQINHELADATIFQSHYSLAKHLELGLEFRNSVIIPNAVNPDIFNAHGRVDFDPRRKIRLISASWSDNPNKGGPFYKNLEKLIDWNRFDYTFVGRSSVSFNRIKVLPPVPSYDLARILKKHDIYITASLHEACSNSIVEALSCGLPCLYMRSGSNGELVGDGGFGFSSEEEASAALERLVDEYEARQAKIAVLSISAITRRYLSVLGVNPCPSL